MKKISGILAAGVLGIILIIPGIIKGGYEKQEFADRRARLMKQIGNSMAVFRGAELKLRNGDVYYDFRQTSDFYYLTGYEEPDAAFFLLPEDDMKFVLFVRKKGFGEELFGGKQKTPKELMMYYGADTVFYMNEFNERFEEFLSGKEKFYYTPVNESFDDKVYGLFNKLIGLESKDVMDPSPMVHEMRLIKSPYEIRLLQKSIDITCNAQIEAMKNTAPGMNEYEIAAMVDYIFHKNGSERRGFPSIVASGLNSTVLHYEKNNGEMNNGDLLMLDIGAEYGYYSADVTRTFPVNGKFSDLQKDIYQIALSATTEAVNMVAPGVGFKEMHQRSIQIINEGLYKLGLISDKESNWQYRVWLIYWSYHWLGLDTHDVGDAGFGEERGRILEPGMVLAIEPGIYINKQLFDDLPELGGKIFPFISKEELNEFIAKVRPAVEKYADICCRIEDDVLVTENGAVNLSAKAPREIEDIERVMTR